MRPPRVAFALVVLAGLLAACRTLPRTPRLALEALAAKPAAHLRGNPVAFGRAQVLNREDFVYDARLSPDGATAAFARLGPKSFFLRAEDVQTTPRTRFDVVVAPLEFDVEAVEFSPDGLVIATACRDGVLRVYDGQTGTLLGSRSLGAPLTAVAFHPSGEWVAVGSAAGGLAVLAWPRLTESVEVQGHGDEVRGLVFARDGTLYTGSWDRTLAAWRLIAPEGEAEVADGGAVAGAVALRELRRFTFPSTLNDVSVDAKGARLGVAFSESKAQRTYEVYRREKRGEVEPSREWDVGAIVDATSGQVLRRGLGHHGVVASAAISPDGSSLVTGGWDRFVLLHGSAPRAARLEHGLAVRRVRFSRDGRFVIVAAWTPQVPTGNHQSSPAAQLVEVEYLEAKVED